MTIIHHNSMIYIYSQDSIGAMIGFSMGPASDIQQPVHARFMLGSRLCWSSLLYVIASSEEVKGNTLKNTRSLGVLNLEKLMVELIY